MAAEREREREREGERESRLMRPKGARGETAQRHCFFLWRRPMQCCWVVFFPQFMHIMSTYVCATNKAVVKLLMG